MSGARLFSPSHVSCYDPNPARHLAGVRGVRLRSHVEQKALASLQREHTVRPVPEGRQFVQQLVVGPKTQTPERGVSTIEGNFLPRSRPRHVIALVSQIPVEARVTPRRGV